MEVMQKVSDKPPARHAKCGGKLEKEWSRTGFQFKGSGWYVTESKESKADASSSSSESKSDSTAKTTTEPKTEKKTAGATPAGD
jgi:predicted nucleic acid-binding Zn ribbon protein